MYPPANSNVTITRFAQTEPMLWKNGLGKTTQLAIHPPGSTPENFAWRVSIARLEASAPFSRFDGIDRCLAVLQGAMMLRGLREPVSLTPQSPPCYFSGSEAVDGQVVDQPVLDLNVMYRASHWEATMQRVRWPTATTFTLAPSQLLCSVSDRIDLGVSGEGAVHLARYDLLRVSHVVELEISGGTGPAEAYLIEFRRRSVSA